MTEEIIFEDKRYKFYEDKIYGKTRFQYLKIYLAGRGNGRGKFLTQRRYWSFITTGNQNIYQIDYQGKIPICPLDIFPQKGEERDEGLC